MAPTSGSADGAPPGRGVRVSAARHELHQGPLPHPDILRLYDSVVPGLAERIVKMAEREQAHRHEMDLRLLRSSNRRYLSGYLSSLAMIAATFGTAVWLLAKGQDISGLVMLVTALATIVSVFIWGRRKVS